MNITSGYSILKSTLAIDKTVKACKEYGYNQVILCDNNSMSGVVEFYKECKDNEIKPILGVCLKICEQPTSDTGPHNKMYNLHMIAQNTTGYYNLVKLINKANCQIYDTGYEQLARLHIDDLKGLTDGVVCIQGGMGSELEIEKEFTEYTLAKYREVFPKVLIAGQDIAWHEVRYLRDEGREDFLLLLSVLAKCKLNQLNDVFGVRVPDCQYFLTQNFPLPRKGGDNCDDELLKKTEEFLSSIEDYDILCKPKVPRFDCPDGMSQQEYLTYLCREGWKRRFPKWQSEEKKKIYSDRVKYELEVLQGCELDGYFLVVQDYINWAKRQGWLIGHSRGSSGGCLVSYLLGITEIDPIPYSLQFERFYSADRSAGGVVSLPDIDTDFPKYKREFVIEYVETKYGLDKVYHIATFNTLNGAGAVKAVLKAHDIFTDKKIDSITRRMPQANKVADKMEAQQEKSLIIFILKNYPDILKELAIIKDGEIVGDYAYHIKQAIRIESSIRGYGIHASGILISNTPIDEIAPLVIESDGSKRICGFDMHSAESVGLVKADILGLKSLDVLMDIRALLRGDSEDQ